MYLEQRVEKLENALHFLLTAMEKDMREGDGLSDAVQEILYGATEVSLYDLQLEQTKAVTCIIEEKDTRPLKIEQDENGDEVLSEPEQAKTLDDVRAAVTQVMKADKTKKQTLQALLKKHGADRVSELDESKFAIVIDTIEKGEF
jgi:hypothetical protein